MHSVLIIDDDAQVLLMLRMTYEEAGFRVVEACNGLEGINKFTESPTDLVVTDIFMPEKEGIETIVELKQLNPDVKLIAISGGGKLLPDEYLSFASRLGALRTFEKPIDRELLLRASRELLEEPE